MLKIFQLRFRLQTLLLVTLAISIVTFITAYRRQSTLKTYWGHPWANKTEVIQVDGNRYETWFVSLHHHKEVTDAVVICSDLRKVDTHQVGLNLNRLKSVNVHFIEVTAADQVHVRPWEGNKAPPGGLYDSIMSGVIVLDQLNFKRERSERSRIGVDQPALVHLQGHGIVSILYVNDWGHVAVKQIRGPRALISHYESFARAHPFDW